MSQGRKLTVEQLEAACCCFYGLGRFRKRYGDWVIIDEDWAQLEWKQWEPVDLYWLCRPVESMFVTRVPLLSPWAGEAFRLWINNLNLPRGLWVEASRPDFAAYFASIYVDDGKITDAQTPR